MAAYPPTAAYPPPTGGYTTPSSQVELSISCKKLIRSDVLSKSDPLVAVFTQSGDGKWSEFGRTEQIKNNQDPVFSKMFEFQYRFEEVQKLKFIVYDLDNDTDSLGDDDFLGMAFCTLGEIVSTGTFTKKLKFKEDGADSESTITIRAEEVSQNQLLIDMKFSAAGLDKKDFLGKSDPFLELERENPDGSYTPVYKTPVIKKTLDPSWPSFTITSQKLCGNDPSRRIRVKCYDWDEDTSNDLIGQFFTTLGDLTKAAEGDSKLSCHASKKYYCKLEWEVINPSKQAKKKSYKNSGKVFLEVKVTRAYSFLDYIIGGCQINFTVGIDFTGSNGNPTYPSSLHYIDPEKPNQYMQALMAVGSICQDYDTDKLFPALGFGAKIGDEVSHEFALNGNPQNPYCFGIGGVVQAYQSALRNVKLWGPTNAAPIIKHVAGFAFEAAKNPSSQQYFVLLMLTDGELTDMPDTMLAIIRASKLPMSIIIVGVGDANFDSMKTLDGDDGKLRFGPEIAERDIVQFVPFRDFKHSSPEALARAVLAEVPQQLTEYMRNKGILPIGKTA